MEGDFIKYFGSWYMLTIDIILLLGIIFYTKLPRNLKNNPYFWLPFLILAFTVFYENLGAYTHYNFEFKKAVNAFLGNTENPEYNLWLFNITNKQILTILYLFLIKSWVEPSKKKYINWMVILFVFAAMVLQLTGIEPLYLSQPIIFTIGANMILISSGLYFIGLMTNKKYLATNPLRLLSFWLMTFILFTYSLTYFTSVSLIYLYNNFPDLGASFILIDLVFGVFNLLGLLLAIASPQYPSLFEEEPFFQSRKEISSST